MLYVQDRVNLALLNLTMHISIFNFVSVCLFVCGVCGKNVSFEKPVESIHGVYLRDVADKLSENFNSTNYEELGIGYIKVSSR